MQSIPSIHPFLNPDFFYEEKKNEPVSKTLEKERIIFKVPKSHLMRGLLNERMKKGFASPKDYSDFLTKSNFRDLIPFVRKMEDSSSLEAAILKMLHIEKLYSYRELSIAT